MSYASQTSVSVARSKAELERLLTRYGADQFAYLTDTTGAMVAFRMKKRHVRFLMPMPPRDDFVLTPGGRARKWAEDIDKAWEQAQRSRWRGLVLIVKAKLEAVETGISSFEREFLSDIVLPDGRTVHDLLAPQLEDAYSSAEMPAGIRLALPERT